MEPEKIKSIFETGGTITEIQRPKAFNITDKDAI